MLGTELISVLYRYHAESIPVSQWGLEASLLRLNSEANENYFGLVTDKNNSLNLFSKTNIVQLTTASLK